MGSCYPRTHLAPPKPSLHTLLAGGQEGNSTRGLLLAYAFFQRLTLDRYIDNHVYTDRERCVQRDIFPYRCIVVSLSRCIYTQIQRYTPKYRDVLIQKYVQMYIQIYTSYVSSFHSCPVKKGCFSDVPTAISWRLPNTSSGIEGFSWQGRGGSQICSCMLVSFASICCSISPVAPIQLLEGLENGILQGKLLQQAELRKHWPQVQCKYSAELFACGVLALTIFN